MFFKMMIKRLSMLTLIFGAAVSVLYMHIFSVITGNEYKQTALGQGSYTVETGSVNANIYDCNMKRLVNSGIQNICAVNPDSDAVKEILPHLAESREDFYSELKYGKPFLCMTDTDDFSSENITAFEVPARYSENQPAQHIIGYTSGGSGVCGIELSYDTFLRSFSSRNSVKYKVDGSGNVLEGIKKEVSYAEDMKAGVVTSIDYDIQMICEKAAENIEKGAVVVMDIKTGEIKACVSRPSYSVSSLEKALDDEDSPLINRVLYPYNAGSVFKLMICQCALESGISDNFTYKCTGSIDINGQIFNCHEKDGHGYQDMKAAVSNSCNTYFIELSRKLSASRLIETAKRLGFGSETRLADNLYGMAGNLPSYDDMKLPAEKANFSFGQGKLSVTPLQVTQMVCAVANNGNMPSARLIEGITYDGINIENRSETVYSEVMTAETASELQKFMTAAVNENPESNAYSDKVMISAKTSTAQTGVYDDYGNELCHAWASGYFPSYAPQYAVTVMAENGGYGNTAASPVLKEIAENISDRAEK